MTADVFENWLLGMAKKHRAHIVLPEGDDDRILTAAGILLAEDVCDLTILGVPEEVTARAAELGVTLDGATLVNPWADDDPHREEFAQQFYELRKTKGVSLEQARETMTDISYYATMMIHNGLADGMVSGASHTTAHTIKPSFQIIKTKPGRVRGVLRLPHGHARPALGLRRLRGQPQSHRGAARRNCGRVRGNRIPIRH